MFEILEEYQLFMKHSTLKIEGMNALIKSLKIHRFKI